MTKKFTIQEVENLTGIKAATLRIWEKRFNFSKPERVNGNRFYTLEDLELLIYISQLKDNGYPISKLALLNAQTIFEKTIQLHHHDDKYRSAINGLIISMFSLDMYDFENHLNRYFNEFGVPNTLEKIIIPFLEKINFLYATKPYNEVLIALTTIRGKIIYCIESLDFKNNSEKSAVLFLPKNEQFDLILLYVCYVLKSQGYKTLYLGTNIPEENIMVILKQNKPDHLFTYVTHENKFNMPLLLTYIKEKHPGQILNVLTSNKTTLSLNGKTEVINFMCHQQLAQQTLIA